MHVSVRFGRCRIGGGPMFWMTFGWIWLACVLMFGSIAAVVYATACAVRYVLRRSAGHLTAGQAP